MLRDDALKLNDKTLPTSGEHNEIRNDPLSGKIVRYDSSLSSWIPLAGSGAGSSVSFQVVSGNAPLGEEEFGLNVWIFESGGTQYATALVKIPNSYNAGSQIFLRIPYYSPSNAGTTKFQSSSYLVRKNTDAISSTTNVHASTNVALSAGLVGYEYKEAVLDLTSSTGQVNSVSVSAGDTLRVVLSRGTDTETDVLKFIPGATELVI